MQISMQLQDETMSTDEKSRDEEAPVNLELMKKMVDAISEEFALSDRLKQLLMQEVSELIREHALAAPSLTQLSYSCLIVV